jgi:lipid-A-disaccharide synthase-like uncharacterized protein
MLLPVFNLPAVCLFAVPQGGVFASFIFFCRWCLIQWLATKQAHALKKALPVWRNYCSSGLGIAVGRISFLYVR